MRKTRLGQELITAMNEVITLPPEPSDWAPGRVARLRRKTLKFSQPVFAAYLGVTSAAVKAWEQGLKKPNSSARRLLDLIAKDPERLTGLIRKVACDAERFT